MQLSRSIRSSIITVTIILAGAILTNPVKADPITIQLGSLSGTIDPITYTTGAGTFTTSPITVTLNMSSPSFFTVDPDTGVITAHTVMDLFFNDGMGNDLSGTLVVDEIGMLGPQPIPMQITSGVLSGAGAFSGTTVGGINPTKFDPNFIDFNWELRSPGPDVVPPVFISLPPGFLNGDNIPIEGTLVGTAIPEPATLLLLGTGLAGVAIKTRRRVQRR